MISQTILSPTIGAIRVSTEQQAERYGPDRQRQDVLREAERAGLDVSQWVEEAISGANDERAAENTYYELARQHPGANVIFSHPNRVGRHVEVTVGIARRIHKLGGTVWIAGIGSLRDRRNWKEFLRDSVDAENEYSNLIYNLASGQEGKARRGLWPHGTAPWGYVLARNANGVAQLPEIVPELAPAVVRLFELGERAGSFAVSQKMAAEGWPAPTEAGWVRKTVSNLLTNSHYTGVRMFRGIRITFPAIITPEQFARVQAQRSERRTHSSGRGIYPLLLTGHLRCADCGTGMVRDSESSMYTRKDGERVKYATYVNYRCWKAKTGACTNRRRWKEADLDALAWQALTVALSTPERLAQVAAPVAAPVAPDSSGRIAELEAAVERAWYPFTSGREGFTEAMAERMAAPYVAELGQLRRSVAPAVSPTPDFKARSAEFRELLAKTRTAEQRRELLEALNVRLYVDADGVQQIGLDIP